MELVQFPPLKEEWGNTHTIRGRRPALALKEPLPLSHVEPCPNTKSTPGVRDTWAQVTVLHYMLCDLEWAMSSLGVISLSSLF